MNAFVLSLLLPPVAPAIIEIAHDDQQTAQIEQSVPSELSGSISSSATSVFVAERTATVASIATETSPRTLETGASEFAPSLSTTFKRSASAYDAVLSDRTALTVTPEFSFDASLANDDAGIVDSAEAPQTTEDLFAEAATMDDDALREAAGGTDVSFDIADVGINLSQNRAGISDITVDGETGRIAGNSVDGNSGITTILNNTGNGVVFQNNVQVNIFLDQAAQQAGQ
ncbi:MAG: hypothetical protein AAF850_05880 [Pseudomonadota bacterium]